MLFVASLVRIAQRTRVVIDFHNYGFTILRLTVRNRLILRIAEAYEKFFGRACDYSLCVSQAMKEDLQQNWRIPSKVVYDKPNVHMFDFNQPVSADQLLSKYHIKLPASKKSVEVGKDFVLLVSSTSWTKDEDFGILLQAMEGYELESQK